MEEKLAYKAAEAAKMLAISPRTLWTLTNCGKIKAARIGKAVRYSRDELLRFLSQAEGKNGISL